MPRRVAGRHAAVLAECRRQLRQPFERRIRPHVIVLREDLDPLARLDLDRDDFLFEPPGLPCGVRELLAANRVAILLLARDAVFRGAVLGRLRHVQPQCVSRSADHSVSSSCPCPRRKPLRSPRMTCGAWLMLSMPPVSTRSASPSSIIWPPLTAAWMPEPHRRLTVSAGTSTGRRP